MKDFHRLLILTAAGVVSLGLSLGLGSCQMDEDDDPPARIADLFYFFDADALFFNGRVSEGVQVEPATTRVLAWTTPGDDKFEGKAALYDLRYIRLSELPAGTDGGQWLLAHFGLAHQMASEPYPTDAGKLQQLLLPRIDPGDTVWFAVRTYDEIGNKSKVSNAVGMRIRHLSVPLHGATATMTPGFGAPVSKADDYNGAGSYDYLVGSPTEGRAYLFLGPPGASLFSQRPNVNGTLVYQTIAELVASVTYEGLVADEFGSVVAGLGKINNDAYPDVAVGAPGAAAGAGRLYVDYGKLITTAYTIAGDSLLLRISGEAAGDRFGAAAASAGDQNADQLTEVLAGAPGALGGRGKAYVFRGVALGVGDLTADTAVVEVWGEAAGDGLGSVVASIGDVNGDGYADLALGAPDYDWGATVDCGAVYIFYGGPAFFVDRDIDLSAQAADVTIIGSAAGRRFGSAISGGGSLGGDAVGDLAIVGGSTVYVFLGGDAGFPPLPLTSANLVYHDGDALAQLSRPGVGFGTALSGEGDLNVDGAQDLIVCAPGEARCYVYYGPIVASSDGAGYREVLEGPAGYGKAAAVVGDINADGYPDFLIGAPDSGEAYLTF